MILSEELNHWGYHSNLSDVGKRQHRDMAKLAGRLEALEEPTAELLTALEAFEPEIEEALKLHIEAVDKVLTNLEIK